MERVAAIAAIKYISPVFIGQDLEHLRLALEIEA